MVQPPPFGHVILDILLPGVLSVPDIYRWGLHKHGKKGKGWVKDGYRHRKGDGKWTFRSDEEQLFRPTDVKMKRHVKAINTRNPYMDTEYFLERQKDRKYERGYRDEGFAM